MKKWLEVLREDVSENLQKRILSGADQALTANRTERRRSLFWWMGSLVTAGVALAIFPRVRKTEEGFQDSDESLVMEMEWVDQEAADVMADIDLIEELDLIENWNGEV